MFINTVINTTFTCEIVLSLSLGFSTNGCSKISMSVCTSHIVRFYMFYGCSMAVPKKTSTSVCTRVMSCVFISSKFKFIIIIVELLFD